MSQKINSLSDYIHQYEKSIKEDFIIVCRNKVCSNKIYEINSIESFLQYEKSV